MPRSPDVYGDGVSVCLARAALAAHAWAAQGGGRNAADRPDALKSEAFEWAQAAALSRAAKALAGYGARLEAAARNASDAVRAYNTALWSHDAVEDSTWTPSPSRTARPAVPLWPNGSPRKRRISTGLALGSRIEARSIGICRTWIRSRSRRFRPRSGNAARLLGEDEILVEAFIPPDGELGLVFAATRGTPRMGGNPAYRVSGGANRGGSSYGDRSRRVCGRA